MAEKLGKIYHPKDAKVFMDEQELVREYLHTDKITNIGDVDALISWSCAPHP